MAISKNGSGNLTLDALLQGTRKVESSGNYGALGPITKSGDRAYGAYQVMGSNIPSWTQQALGVRMTPQEFLNNTEAQDLVARTQFAHNLMKYGNPQDAASVWFTGRPVSKAGNASDGYNTNNSYIDKVMKAGGIDFNGRPGDSMALGRMATASSTQDPRSFVATADDNTPQIGGVAPQAQAINLTEENSQPLNNLGSTLANMGASIASLDRGGTGIASLNASKVASNLAAQEAAREREVGWKYAGQTQNGQGMIFQNSKGQIRVEPLAEGFTGQKEPESIRALRILQSDPSLVGLKKELSGGETAPMEPGLKKDLGSLWAAGDDSVLSRQDAKSRQEIMAAGIDEIKAAGLDPKEVMANRIAYKGDLADDRRRSQIIAALDTYKGEFLAGAKQASDYIRKLPEGLQQKPLNELYQWAQTNAGTPEGKAINDAKVALESMNRGYNRAVSTSSNGNVTGEKRISELFNPALPAKMLLSGVEVLTGDVTRLNKFALEARDNARARRAGKAIPHPEIEDEDKAISAIVGETGGSKRSTIGNTTKAPTNIRTPDELKNWLSSSGLKKGEKFTLPDGSEGIVP